LDVRIDAREIERTILDRDQTNSVARLAAIDRTSVGAWPRFSVMPYSNLGGGPLLIPHLKVTKINVSSLAMLANSGGF
jgi:hypothetical protein